MADCDLLIIGAGPAAWSCAMTARKRNLTCKVIAAESSAGWLSKADRVDNYPGMPAVSGHLLLQTFESQAVSLGAEVIHAQARQIQPMGEEFMVLAGNDLVLSRAVVLAMGAARPSLLPGEEELLGHGVSWCGTCDGMFYRGKDVAVISYWQGGVEEAQFLAGLARRVDYYTMQPHNLSKDDRIHLTDGKARSLEPLEDKRIRLITDLSAADYDGVFIFRPAVAPDRLLPGLQLDGPFIHTDRRMACNLPRVYACGDCTGKPLQIAKAVGEGNIAAISAAEDLA